MGELRRPGASARPRTFVGRWLRAAMLDRRDERDCLVGTLNRGSATGWNDDEPAVVEIVAELVLRHYFGAGEADPEKAASLAREVTAGLGEINRPLDEQHADAVIWSALGVANARIGPCCAAGRSGLGQWVSATRPGASRVMTVAGTPVAGCASPYS